MYSTCFPGQPNHNCFVFARLIEKKILAPVFWKIYQFSRYGISTINYATYGKYSLNTKGCLSNKNTTPCSVLETCEYQWATSLFSEHTCI